MLGLGRSAPLFVQTPVSVAQSLLALSNAVELGLDLLLFGDTRGKLRLIALLQRLVFLSDGLHGRVHFRDLGLGCG